MSLRPDALECNTSNKRFTDGYVEVFMKSKENHLFYFSGYTLIELLVVLAVVGIITIPIMTFFISNYSTYLKESNKLDVQQVARTGMDVMMTNMRKAKQSSIRIIKNTINGHTTYQLELVIEGNINKRYTYYLSGTNLLQKEEEQQPSGYWGKKAANQLMYNVKQFKVIENNDLITITIKIEIDGVNGYELELSNSHKIRH